jgi:DNA-binding LacI/PurR family transcriptional regulator
MSKEAPKTIADIARLAGVSKSTVSRALNDSPLIGEETKDRIRAIARQHNFRLNVPARQLSMRESRTLGFVTHAYYAEWSVADLFGMEILGGVTSGVAARGYDLLVLQVNPMETEWAQRYLDSGRVDGFILMTATRKQRHIRALLKMDAPFIAWGPTPPGAHYCCVCGDNVTGGKLATEHLVNSGRRRIAFIGGPPDELEVQHRFQGYESALEAAGRETEEALIEYGDFMDSSGAVAMGALLERAPDLDGVFVNSDLMAIEAMKALRERGRRVPEDVAVVGYDDLSIAKHSNPPLTTIRQSVPLAGRLLAENLIQYLKTGVVTHLSIPAELVVRESA